MSTTTPPRWESKRTPETLEVERLLSGEAKFEQVAAYRYNSASIRLRIIDPRFEGLSIEKRDDLVEPWIKKLPRRTQADIMSLFTFAPSELQPESEDLRTSLLNAEFENPSPSHL